jgi:phage tail-like protein
VNGFLYLNDANAWSQFDLGTDVVVDPADGALVLKSAGGKFVRSGAFKAGAFTVGDDEAVPWYRLRISAGELREDEHIELFTLTSDSAPTPVALSDPLPFPEPHWYRAPRDVGDVLVPGAAKNPGDPLFPSGPARQLWIGGVLRGNSRTSPRIRQIRVDYQRETAVESLPAVYRRAPGARERLERLLSLTENPLRDLDSLIENVVRLFDPAAAPAGEHPAWLSWLAAWLDFDLTDRWSEAETRELVARAFQLYGTRGTIEGLRRYLKLYAGVDARISEPAAATRLWALGVTSTLGFTTALAPGSADGAVLDATATLDASHLTRGEHFGATLFEDVAHRFCVDVYCADLRHPGTLDDVRAVLDREKPAHTMYSLRVIAPALRVGVQAQLGIDTIVGSGPAPAMVGGVLDAAPLGERQTDCTSARDH